MGRSMDLQFLINLLFRYINSLLFLLIITFIGVFLADILFSIGLHRKIGRFLEPLLRLANLPRELSIPMITGVIDSRAEHAIVSSLVKTNVLSHREVVVYNLVSLPFGGSRAIIQYVLPIAIAGLGVATGSLYIALSILGLFIGMLLGIIGGRIVIRRNSRRDTSLEKDSTLAREGGRVDIRRSISKALSMAINIGVKYVIIIAILLLLTYLGIFDYLKSLSTPLAGTLLSNPTTIPVTITYAVNPTSAILIAGELLKNGVATWKDVLIALFIGKILFAIISEFPRHSFPFYISVYPPKLAVKLTLALVLYTFISTPIIILLILVL